MPGFELGLNQMLQLFLVCLLLPQVFKRPVLEVGWAYQRIRGCVIYFCGLWPIGHRFALLIQWMVALVYLQRSKSTALQAQYLPRRGTQCAKLIIYNIRVIVGDVSRSVFRWLWVWTWGRKLGRKSRFEKVGFQVLPEGCDRWTGSYMDRKWVPENRCMMAERFGKILMRLMYFRVKRRNLKEFVFWTATSGVPWWGIWMKFILEVHRLTILKDLICDQPNFEKNSVFDW